MKWFSIEPGGGWVLVGVRAPSEIIELCSLMWRSFSSTSSIEGRLADRGGMTLMSVVGDVMGWERRKMEGGGMLLAATGPYCRRVGEGNEPETTVAEESDA